MNKTKKLNNEEKKVLNKLKELAKKIIKHNKLYHGKDRPLITDREYDNLVKDNKKLEKQILKFEKKPIKNIRKIALDIIKKL